MLESAPAALPRPAILRRREGRAPARPREGSKPPPWAALLARFYHRHGLALPRMICLDPQQMPAPSRRLLAHNHDMTPTLERFYGERLALQVCGLAREGPTYLREVILALGDSGTPVAYGAICIQLKRFSEPVQKRIVANEHPFGRILESEQIAHMGWPQAFFVIDADARLRRLLDFEQAQPLYGRRNVLLDGQRRLLAEVIEILAPLEAEPGAA